MLALLQMFVPGSDVVSEMEDATDTVSHVLRHSVLTEEFLTTAEMIEFGSRSRDAMWESFMP